MPLAVRRDAGFACHHEACLGGSHSAPAGWGTSYGRVACLYGVANVVSMAAMWKLRRDLGQTGHDNAALAIAVWRLCQSAAPDTRPQMTH